MSFEDGIDAWGLCQVHFRDLCSLLDGQDTRVRSHLSSAHCNGSEGLCRKSSMSRRFQAGFRLEPTHQKGQRRITGWCLDSAAAMELPGWRQCLLKAMSLLPNALLFAHLSWDLSRKQDHNLCICKFFSMCVLPSPQERAFCKIL